MAKKKLPPTLMDLLKTARECISGSNDSVQSLMQSRELLKALVSTLENTAFVTSTIKYSDDSTNNLIAIQGLDMTNGDYEKLSHLADKAEKRHRRAEKECTDAGNDENDYLCDELRKAGFQSEYLPRHEILFDRDWSRN